MRVGGPCLTSSALYVRPSAIFRPPLHPPSQGVYVRPVSVPSGQAYDPRGGNCVMTTGTYLHMHLLQEAHYFLWQINYIYLYDSGLSVGVMTGTYYRGRGLFLGGMAEEGVYFDYQ